VPRRTHPLLLAAALAVGLLLALGVAACGSGGSQSAETLEAPPLTVGTGVTLPSTSTTATTTTSTTSTTDSSSTDSGGASATGGGTGGAVDTGGDTGGGATGGDTGGGTGGGTAPDTGGGTTTPTPTQPSNPGGAAPNYQSFCNENPGAC
jgi:hypothetical protein